MDHKETDTSKPPRAPLNRAALACFLGMWAVGLFAVIFPALDYHLAYGVIYAGIGLLVLLFPPQVALPKWAYAGLLLLMIGSMGSLLPAAIIGKPEWRTQLESLGLNLGAHVTTIPMQTLEQVWALMVCVVALLLLLGHRMEGPVLGWLGWLFSCGVSLYALLAIIAQETGWRPSWDMDPSFGFFPNRNHTATLLVMGNITALGALFSGVRAKRHALAGLSAVTLAICLGTTLGFNVSRAGVVLTAVLVLIWGGGLGARYLSRRVLVACAVGAVVTLGIFLSSRSEVKQRMERSVTDLSSADAAEARPNEFRMLIYRDTLQMLRHEPWTGIGLGGFQYVFPQYRVQSASAASAVHPESDWLMVAAEMGWPVALLLAVGVVALFWMSLRDARGKSGWPWRWSCWLGAVVVPLHGIFDVPAHRIGLLFGAFWLLGLTLREGTVHSKYPGWARWGFRVAGLAILASGIWLLCGAAGLAPRSSFANAHDELLEVQRLEAADAAERKVGTNPVGEDKLEIALRVIDRAIAAQPMDAGLHFSKGVLAVNFVDMPEVVEREFEIQRALSPHFVRVPLQQAFAASLAFPKLTESLWQDALRRADLMQQLAPGTELTRGHVLETISQHAAQNQYLGRAALPLLEEKPALYVNWAGRVAPALLNEQLPKVLGLPAVNPATRTVLLNIWEQRGDRAQAAAYRAAHPP